MLGAGSPGSISDDQDLVSDPGDPIHSETLLKELFYKNPVSTVTYNARSCPCNYRRGLLNCLKLFDLQQIACIVLSCFPILSLRNSLHKLPMPIKIYEVDYMYIYV